MTAQLLIPVILTTPFEPGQARELAQVRGQLENEVRMLKESAR